MRQQWELGQALRRRYHGFLSASYRRQEGSARGPRERRRWEKGK